MKKILIAVDDTKSSKEIFGKSGNICNCMSPEEIALVYVQKLEGRSLIDEMLGDAELSTLREAMEGTDFKEALDERAIKILSHYNGMIKQNNCAATIKTITKSGHPAEEILKTAEEEKSDMIIVGSHGNRSPRMLMGSVSREVANRATIPVLIMR